jgi:hypothetical protein
MKSLEQIYPNVALWIKSHGWIEIGYDDFSHSFVRALDIGGMIWEAEEKYNSLDEAMQALDKGIADWLKENRR